MIGADIVRSVSGLCRRAGAFSVVGMGNALVDVGTLNLLAWLMPTGSFLLLVLYNTVSLVLANSNSYLWNSRWTFRGDGEAGARQRIRFILQAALNVLVSNAVLWGAAAFIVSHTTLSAVSGENVAKVVSALVASGVSFLIMRRYVFAEFSSASQNPGADWTKVKTSRRRER